MTNTHKNTFFLISLALSLFVPAALAKPQDQQLWSTITAVGPLSPKSPSVKYWLEIQNRIGEDASRLSQIILRPGLGYQLTPQTSIWVGYARIFTSLPFAKRPTEENRVWEQLLWSKKYSTLRATARSRLEERFIEYTPQTLWRYRQLFKLSIPFRINPNYSLVSYDELFFNLKNAAVKGLDQNRFFVGLGYKPSEDCTIEIGYLNQTIKLVDRNYFRGNDLAFSISLWS